MSLQEQLETLKRWHEDASQGPGMETFFSELIKNIEQIQNNLSAADSLVEGIRNLEICTFDNRMNYQTTIRNSIGRYQAHYKKK